ncbi:MAG: ACT domain-containing protein [Firmicutes bacterium]|nr:ACT domain-containing protein [Bacillota bacterium]
MSKQPKYYIIEASSLPEIILKVAEAKRLISTGAAKTVNEATQMTGISRSAYYKYRESVRPFQNMMSGRILTFQFTLHDEPGVLSTLLTVFAQQNANILTVNSIIPYDGCAVATISAETIDLDVPLEELLTKLRETNGVITAEILGG